MKLRISDIILGVVCVVLLWMVIFKEDDPVIPDYYKDEFKELGIEVERLSTEVELEQTKREETLTKINENDSIIDTSDKRNLREITGHLIK